MYQRYVPYDMLESFETVFLCTTMINFYQIFIRFIKVIYYKLNYISKWSLTYLGQFIWLPYDIVHVEQKNEALFVPVAMMSVAKSVN